MDELELGREMVLGLDLGVQSIGWALMTFEDGEPKAIVDAGVRIFEPGMEGDVSEGKEESRNKARREARQARKQMDRRMRRHRNVAVLLQQFGLLPAGDLSGGQSRHLFFERLDKELFARHTADIPEGQRHQFANTFPYWLRARSLSARLEPFELGRALYHLSQRRGFLSNRKSPRKDDEDEGVVYGDISELKKAMLEAGATTMGAYFAGVDPTDPEGRRIRERHTHRDMYASEFNLIWEAQKAHHPAILTDTARTQLHRAIFFQRPLKVQKHLIGNCQFECIARGAKRDRKRAPWGLLDAQRFRLLQTVNNLWYEDGAGTRYPLTPEQRAALVDALEREGDLTMPKARTAAGLKGKSLKFNLEAGGEKRLPGNRTAAKMRAVFGSRWDTFSKAEQDRIVEDLLSFEKEEPLAAHVQRVWSLDAQAAKAYAGTVLEPDYCNLSRQALAKLLPHLEAGAHYMTAAQEVYGEVEPDWGVLDLLPAVDQAPLGELRNPTVFRVLVEVRKVVNALIQKHGKPDKIRIELARDIKKSKKQRQELTKQNREREKRREKAKDRVAKEMGDEKPSRDDIEKMMLAEECNWECPYTGKHISMGALLGNAPQFDVEHIVPFSRCLDNSFMNKTLCYHEENRSVKKNQTPFEAYAHTDKWEEILARVKSFKGDAARAKLRRFEMNEEDLDELLEDFSNRALNDTRYASRLAAKFCGLLYGMEFRRHIQVSSGQLTAELRKAWKLNDILGIEGEKVRDDHRHHAVDAIAVSLATPRMVKRVSVAAQQVEARGQHRWWREIGPPWEGFLGDARAAIAEIVVSHRAGFPVRGPLHEETNYASKKDEDGNPCAHVRKPIHRLTVSEVEAIVDPKMREAIKRELTARKLPEPAKAFADRAAHPVLTYPGGARIPIHRVRVRKKEPIFAVGEAERTRHVVNKSNHHVEIVEIQDKKGRVQWEGHVVSLFEAMRRKSKGEAIVKRDHGDGKRFVFSLSQGDALLVKDADENEAIVIVCGISQFSAGAVVIDLKTHNDARPISKIPRQGRTRTPDTLRKSCGRKIRLLPLGETRNAND